MSSEIKIDLQERSIVPFDIETTGFCSDDIITTFIVYDGATYQIWLNTDGGTVETTTIEESVCSQAELENIALRTCSDESELIQSVTKFTTETLSQLDTVITAYNGERWRSSFDVAMLRNASLRAGGVTLPFAGFSYFDLQPIFDKHSRFQATEPDITAVKMDNLKEFCIAHDLPVGQKNGSKLVHSNATKTDIIEKINESEHTDEEVLSWLKSRFNSISATKQQKDQVGVHKSIIKGVLGITEETYMENEFDPFEDSKNAVTKFYNEDWVDLILHCLADVKKSKELAELAVAYVSPDDFEIIEFPNTPEETESLVTNLESSYT